MNHHCVHVDLDLNVTTDEWRQHCQHVVDKMLSVPGLVWKLWLASPATSSAGGVYLFRDEASATAYVNGPVINALRSNPSIRAVRVRIDGVEEDLSRRTRAISG